MMSELFVSFISEVSNKISPRICSDVSSHIKWGVITLSVMSSPVLCVISRLKVVGRSALVNGQSYQDPN